MDKVNLNFKVSSEISGLLDQLVVLKTVKNMKKSSKREVFEEALIELMKKYNSDYNDE